MGHANMYPYKQYVIVEKHDYQKFETYIDTVSNT